MHPEIGAAVQRFSDQAQREVTSEEVRRIFLDEFVSPEGPYELIGYWPRPDDTKPTEVHGEIRIRVNGEEQKVVADGNGPISAFVHGMQKLVRFNFQIEDYHEQAVGKGADATAYAYVPLKLADGAVVFGVGTDTNIDQAAVKAIVAGLNRIARKRASTRRKAKN
jgi:2-isopropylmalate synthase